MSKPYDTKTLEEFIPAKRDALLAELKKIDPKLVLKLSIETSEHTAGHFSDWHDRFKDGGTFRDGFGKAGQ